MLAKKDNEAIIRQIEAGLANAAKYSGKDWQRFIKEVETVERLSISHQKYDYYANALLKRGLYFYRNDKLDQAIQITKKAADIALKFQYKRTLAHCYINLSGYFQQKNQLGKAIECNYEALKLNPDDIESAHLYNNLAMILYARKEYQKGLEYLDKSIDYYRKLPIVKLAGAYINRGIILIELNDFEEVKKAYKAATRYAKEEKDEFLHATALEGLGKVYFEIDEVDKGLSFFMEALVVANGLNELFLRGSILNMIGLAYEKKGDLEEAIRFFKKSYKLYDKHAHPKAGIENLEMLHKTYCRLGDFENAYQYQSKLLQLKEKQFEESQENSIQEIIQNKAEEIDVLRDKSEVISRQNEELRQYAFIVAHDLREPLRNINGFANLIKRDEETCLSKESEDLLDFLIGASVKMNDLLSDLLKYATIDIEQRKLIQTDMEELIEDVKVDLQQQLEENDTLLTYSDLPSIKCYPIPLRQLLQNFITNSIKFRHPDRPGKMHFSHQQEGKVHTFTFTDNGIGIEPEYLQKIFGIFTRLDKQNYEGTGIGLAICKKVVEKHGGTISAQSDGKSGTTFIFTIVEENGITNLIA